jgi:hypothetical protein
MSVTTAVDMASLANAGAVVSQHSRALHDAVAASGQVLSRLAQEVSGSRSGEAVVEVRRYCDAVLRDLEQTLQKLGSMLTLAADGYGSAESHAQTAVSGASRRGPL